ncbi:response regulator [Marinobacterium maritimum]|uniref:Response regulator n=1 Tax=Marinobacterium maritimum TaxID=500162 RepID=A0ABN1I4M0_9GAMM
MECPAIVFIDDEPSVLNALRRLLRISHRDWKMHFFSSPVQALEALADIAPWVVVADKRMAEMDGVVLLQQVAERMPETIRVLLSGDARLDSAMEGAVAAHFVLRKPFERETIDHLLTRSRVLHQLPLSLSRRRQLGQINGLPVLPRIYQQITLELDQEEPDVAVVASLIREDQGLLSRVLQLVNSPFFGFTARTQEVEVAVMRLGLQTIHNLVLITELYHQGPSRLLKVGERLMREALLLAEQVGTVCDLRKVSKQVRNLAVISGLLHNIGELVLALHAVPAEGDASIVEDEMQLVGAYLLELWGFESGVVEAVQHQRDEVLPEDSEPVAELLNMALKIKSGSADEAQILKMDQDEH